MNIDELAAVARTLSFQGLLRQMQIAFTVRPDTRPGGGARIDLSYSAFDSHAPDENEAQPFAHDQTIDAARLADLDEPGALELFSDMISRLLLHEADEGFFVRGKRHREPAGHGPPAAQRERRPISATWAPMPVPRVVGGLASSAWISGRTRVISTLMNIEMNDDEVVTTWHVSASRETGSRVSDAEMRRVRAAFGMREADESPSVTGAAVRHLYLAVDPAQRGHDLTGRL